MLALAALREALVEDSASTIVNTEEQKRRDAKEGAYDKLIDWPVRLTLEVLSRAS